jgi:hypothetical protein
MARSTNPDVRQRLSIIERSVSGGASLPVALALANATVDAVVSYLPDTIEGQLVGLLLRQAATPVRPGSAGSQQDVSAEVAALDARLAALEARR